MESLKSLAVLYDDRCTFCVEVVRRLRREPSFIPLSFHAIGEADTSSRFPELVHRGLEGEFVAVADTGAVYLGAKGKLMVLFALRRYRRLALNLGSPVLWPVASRIFMQIAGGRHVLSRALEIAGVRSARCDAGVCKVNNDE